jgi:hypothetical protein
MDRSGDDAAAAQMIARRCNGMYWDRVAIETPPRVRLRSAAPDRQSAFCCSAPREPVILPHAPPGGISACGGKICRRRMALGTGGFAHAIKRQSQSETRCGWRSVSVPTPPSKIPPPALVYANARAKLMGSAEWDHIRSSVCAIALFEKAEREVPNAKPRAESAKK